jgi:hypothetical protein
MRPAMYDIGIVPILELSGAQVQAFTGADYAELRDLGASDLMCNRLETLAREPDARFVLSFERQTVTLIT